MQTLTLSEAQQHLVELVRSLSHEGEVVITDNDKPVATLSPVIVRASLRDLSPNRSARFFGHFLRRKTN